MLIIVNQKGEKYIIDTSLNRSCFIFICFIFFPHEPAFSLWYWTNEIDLTYLFWKFNRKTTVYKRVITVACLQQTFGTSL